MAGARVTHSRAARASADAPTYRPPWWFRGRHLQTIWGPLLRRRPRPLLRRERWETPDGDFLDLDWLASSTADTDGSLVVVLHGLEGSSDSHYCRGLLHEVSAAGGHGVVLNFRSCSGALNRLPRLYHSGETQDLAWVVARLIEAAPDRPLALVGVSLGGNVLLKWLGEVGGTAPRQLAAAAAISTPFDLAACAEVLDRGMPRLLYTTNFLRTMKAKVRGKAALLDGQVDLAAALRARTFAEYDRRVTAPIHGFADEWDYWTRSSSGPYLSRILRPCLLINAENDPFVPLASLPREVVADSPWLTALFVPGGGHAGFLDGPNRSWAERVAVAFVMARLAEAAPSPAVC
jgi:hypothetical protein